MKKSMLLLFLGLANACIVTISQAQSFPMTAEAKEEVLVLRQLRHMMDNLGDMGIAMGATCLTTANHNPEDCCTVITPEEVWMECPCGGGTCENEFQLLGR